jgi:hypothetical protein
MRPSSPRLLRSLATPLLCLCAAGHAATPALDDARVGWSEIRMTASKLFLTATAAVRLRTVPGPSVQADLRPFPGGGGVEPGPEVVEMIYEAAGMGRRSRATLLMDPVSGAAIQDVIEDLEGKLRFRVYRFGDRGAYHRTRWPVSAAEERRPPAEWSRATEGLRRYARLPDGRPVSDTTGLLYMLSAADLDQAGDELEVLVFQRRNVQAVRIRVEPGRPVPVEYAELWPQGSVARRGEVQPIWLSLRGAPLPGASAGEPPPEDAGLELLGLHGNLAVALDPATRAPLLISGKVKVLGDVTLRLTAVRQR